MPVPLRFSGAHTHRFSGDWKLNMQNLPGGSRIRDALEVEEDEELVEGDAAQIEARLNAWLCKCIPLLTEFRKPGGDPYAAFASIVFGFPVNKKEHPDHRFIGKESVLGLGFQCGVDKFYNLIATKVRLQGIDIEKSLGKPWTPQLAGKIVGDYRSRYHQIKAMWYLLQQAIETVWSKRAGGQMRIGPIIIRYGEIEGPGGLKMKYHNPRQLANGEYVYTYGYGTYKMYGGKMLENIIQFLDRIFVIGNVSLRMAANGYNWALQVHDSLGYVVKKIEVDKVKTLLYKELCRPPSWAPDIPLNADIKGGPSYGQCC
jgi:DNA polymerase